MYLYFFIGFIRFHDMDITIPAFRFGYLAAYLSVWQYSLAKKRLIGQKIDVIFRTGVSIGTV